MNPDRYANLGFANILDVVQAPNDRAFGFSTQPYDGMISDERKEGPAMLPSLNSHKISRGVYPPSTQPMLPKFELGEVPTFYRQQNSYERQRGFYHPQINLDSRMYSGDLVDAFTALASHGARVPAPLSSDYQGSEYMWGPRQGLPPSHITNGTNFVLSYGEVLRENSLQHRADMLIKEGYDARRVQKVMEEALDDQIREKLKMKK